MFCKENKRMNEKNLAMNVQGVNLFMKVSGNEVAGNINFKKVPEIVEQNFT